MLIRGAHVVTPGRDLGVTSVEVFGGKIVRMGDSPMPSPSGETLEADGLLLLRCHG